MAKKSGGRWFLLLFSLPFAAVGLGFLLFSIIPSLTEWQQMKSWPQVEASLSHVKLVRNSGDDGVTYQASAQYSYFYDGRQYQSDRVAIMGGADNIGDFHEQLVAKLEAAQRVGRPVPAWVNPSDPGDAVLNRDMRWNALAFKLLFALVFGGVGFGIMAWALVSKPSHVDHPEGDAKPWLARREWADNRIQCNSRGGLWFVWAFALLWNAISAPVLFAVPEELAKDNYLVLVGLLFPLVGMLLLAWAIHTSLSWRRFGQLALVMDPFPGAIGGQVGGSLDLPLAYDAQQRFPVTLVCARSYETGSGKNRSRRESLIWQAQGLAYAEPGMSGTRLNFCFDVPANLPASEDYSNDYRLWRLSINADLPGVDLGRQFEIPVYPTGEKSFRPLRLSTEHPQAVAQREALIESVLEIQQIPGGVELFFPMLRNPSGPLWGVLFGLVFGGAGVGMYFAGDAPAILVWSFIPIGALILFFSIKALFGSLRVRLDREGLLSQRYWLGLPIGRDQVGSSDIKRLVIDVSYEQQTTKGHSQVCNIKAETHAGKKIPVAKNLKGRETAQQALEAIASLTGYSQ